ncbi:MAG: adenylate/guanylate cyclase domain-containing protein [Actinobacteria bacterium]|nr:adenylate/guanylate cyclase domain-containing protein [Actinomycetota bacterium]
MSQIADDAREAGRQAIAQGAFRRAYELLAPEMRELGAEDLEALAEAAFWTGKLDEAIELRERAQAAFVEAGDKKRAAMLAAVISRDYFMKFELAVSNGWFAKAERLLREEPESEAHGYLALGRSMNAMMTGDLPTAVAHADEALELGRRFSDRNLEAAALVMKGRSLVLQGQIDEGLAILDETTATAVSGELEPWTTGFVYCCTITSCSGLGDYRRAAEWTAAANRWCDRSDTTGFPGACRVHRATITRLQGDWPTAEAEAEQACAELGSFDPWTTALGFYEIGEIRRRRGEFAAAEQAYAQAKEWGADAHPGLALLRLAQGKIDAAGAAIKRSLANTSDPIGRIHRLPAQVEISLAAGDLKGARAAAEELDRLADAFRIDDVRTPAFEATVCLAWGQIHLAENDAEGAAEQLERAVERWREVGAPYEAAGAQMLLGLALRRLGEEEGARDELRAAKACFERLGAALAVERVAELLGEHRLHRTFMFTDIVDSTRLVEALGEEKWKKLLGWHDRTLRELIEAKGGAVIKQTGDGYFAAFQSPVAALDAAVSIQRTLDEHEPLAPDVRIGVHTGGALHHGDGDYAGQSVHMAARIGALAGGGEILVSRDSVDGGRYPVSEPRAEELKGFEEPVELVTVDWR